jgi:hypothetical protein
MHRMLKMYFYYLALINNVEQCPSWEADSSSVSQIPWLLWKQKFNYCAQDPSACSPSPDPVESVHTLRSYLLKIHYNNNPQSTCRSPKVVSSVLVFQPKFYIYFWPLPCMLDATHLILLDLIAVIIFNEEYKLWSCVLCTFMAFVTSSPLGPKMSLQHPVLKHP